MPIGPLFAAALAEPDSQLWLEKAAPQLYLASIFARGLFSSPSHASASVYLSVTGALLCELCVPDTSEP
jgi:hypothetical protein